MKLSEMKDVTRKIEQGAWVADLPNLPGVSVKVRGTFNSDYNRLANKLRQKYSAQQLLTDETTEALETELLIETILLDWNIEDFPFSKEEARKVLQDPDLAVFRQAVRFAGNVVAREGRTSIEADAKN